MMTQNLRTYPIREILVALVINGEFGEEGETIQQEMKGEVLRRYSVPVLDVLENEKMREYCRDRGVVYVGEFPYLRGLRGRMHTRISNILGLPKCCNPLNDGWVPPYWSDADFMNALGFPCLTYFDDYGRRDGSPWDRESAEKRNRINTLGRWLHSHHVHYLGQLLNTESTFLSEISRDFEDLVAVTESLFAFRKIQPLRAGMIVPRSWKPDVSIPQVWLHELECITKEIEQYETPCAWVVSWSVSNGYYCHIDRAFVHPVFYEDPKASDENERWTRSRKFISDLEKELAAGETYSCRSWETVHRTDGIIGGHDLDREKRRYFPGMNRVNITTHARGRRVFLRKEDAELFSAQMKTKAGESLDDQ